MTVTEQAEAIRDLLDSKKAEDIRLIHVTEKTIIADYFVICTGRSAPHVKSLCDDVEEKEKALSLHRLRTEGYYEGKWIIIDYGDILVHIFNPEAREFYNLERLWE